MLASLLQALALLGSYAGWFDKTLWMDYFANRNALWRIWEFIVGVAAAQLLFDGHLAFLRKQYWRNLVLCLSLLLILGIALAPAASTEMSLLIARQFRLGVLNILPFAAVIVALTAGNTFLSPILRTKGFVLLGEASFALYIYHWFPVTLFSWMEVAGYSMGRMEVFVAVTATVGFSILSFKWYETPIRKLLRKFTDRSATRVLP